MSEILGIIQLIVWVVTIVGFYYKMRNDINLSNQKAKTDNENTLLQIKLANERIDKIEAESKVRWVNHDNAQKEHNQKLTKIVVDIGKICTDMEWVKNKLNK